MNYKHSFKLLLFFVLIFVSQLSKAQSWQWAKKGDCPFYSLVNSIAISENDNSEIVAGVFSGRQLQLDTVTLYNTNPAFLDAPNDIFIAKYNLSGDIKWVKQIGGLEGETVEAMVTDKWGNIYIAGATQSTVLKFGSDSIVFDNGLYQNIFLAKYSSSGNVIWIDTFSRLAGVELNLTIDTSGYIYLTSGFLDSIFQIDTITLTKGDNSLALFYAKLDSSGHALWAKSFGNTSYVRLNSITTDVYGNGYIFGTFDSAGLVLGSTTLVKPAGAHFFNLETYWAKFNTSTGEIIWAKQSNGDYSQIASDIKADLNGNIYLTGKFKSVAATFGSTTLFNSSIIDAFDFFLVKSDSSGNVKWAKKSSGIYNEYGVNLSCKNNNRIVLAGHFSSKYLWETDTIINTDTLTGENDLFIAIYDSLGNVDYATNAKGYYSEYQTALAENEVGEIFIGGASNSTSLTFGSNTLMNTSEQMLYFAKLSPYNLSVNNSVSSTSITVYPNPASSWIQINSSLGTVVRIIDLSGRILQQINMNSTKESINIKEWTPGVYLIENISPDSKKSYTRLVKD